MVRGLSPRQSREMAATVCVLTVLVVLVTRGQREPLRGPVLARTVHEGVAERQKCRGTNKSRVLLVSSVTRNGGVERACSKVEAAVGGSMAQLTWGGRGERKTKAGNKQRFSWACEGVHYQICRSRRQLAGLGADCRIGGADCRIVCTACEIGPVFFKRWDTIIWSESVSRCGGHSQCDFSETSVDKCTDTDSYSQGYFSETSVAPCADTDSYSQGYFSETSVDKCTDTDSYSQGYFSETSVAPCEDIDSYSQDYFSKTSVAHCADTDSYIQDYFSETSVAHCADTDSYIQDYFSETSVAHCADTDSYIQDYFSETFVAHCADTDSYIQGYFSGKNAAHCAVPDGYNQSYLSDSAAHCADTASNNCTHSSAPNGDTATSRLNCPSTKPPTPTWTAGPRCRREIVFLLALWLSHVLLNVTSTALAAHASALPVSRYPSQLPSSNKRYSLLPASVNNDSIFLFFNPPEILNLKINTRQSVTFNFTLYPRPFRLVSNSKAAGNAALNPDLKTVPLSDNPTGASMTTKTTNHSTRNNNIPSTASSKPTLSPLSSVSYSTFSANDSGSTGNASPKRESSGVIYWVMIYSDDDNIARPVIISPSGLAAAHSDAKGSYVLMAVLAGRPHSFLVEARHIGRVTMTVAVVDVVGSKEMPQASYVQAVAASEYPVTAVRGERIADIVFNSCAAAIAIIISFGIGAVTDTDSLRKQLKHPVALIVGFCCEFIIMPVLAFGLAMMLPLDKDIRFGLLCVACVPGGGISHVAVIIADGDVPLSLTLNLISFVAMLGTAPLWIFVLGQYFLADPQSVLNPRTIPIYKIEIWLATAFFAYAAGLTVKRMRPVIADGILMWLIKPFLLLASILYITLGVYINMYVFEVVDGYALMGAMLLPLCGCVVGGVLAAVCQQNYACVKTIALETSSLNCLVVMVALRFSLKQPDADLAAVIPIWVMFTIPGFFVFLAICNKVKNFILNFWRNRGNKETDAQSSSKAYSVSSSVVSPPGTTTLSAPLVTADGIDDDATISSTSNQKVTVL